MIHANSLHAFATIQPTLTKREAEVLEHFKDGGEYTDEQIAAKMGTWPSAISGRIGSLLDKGKLSFVRNDTSHGRRRVTTITRYSLFE